MGRIQVVNKQKVYVAPFSVQGWDGALGAHPRKLSGVFGPLCVRF
jgi:hypothetical protein